MLCPNGHEVTSDASFCRTCGAQLESQTRPVANAPKAAPQGPPNPTPASRELPLVSSLPRLSNLAWLGLGAAAAMIVGSFAPWGKTVGLLNVSISGTDGSNDGWLVVGAAIAGAGGLVMHSHGKRIAALGPLLAGAAASYVTYHDRGNLTDAANENTSDYVALQVGWGLNLAMGASIVLGVVALVALLGNQDSPGMKVPAVESETEHEFDHPASGSPSRTNQAGIPTAPPGSGATFRKAKRQKHP